MIDPIRLSFEVDCPPDRAFDVWTARISGWWPADHTVSAESGLAVVIEGRPGGRIFERTAAGVEHDWGEVTVWEPPTRFGYLWHLRRDRVDATEGRGPFRRVRPRLDARRDRASRLGAAGCGRPGVARPQPRRLVDAAAVLPGGDHGLA